MHGGRGIKRSFSLRIKLIQLEAAEIKVCIMRESESETELRVGRSFTSLFHISSRQREDRLQPRPLPSLGSRLLPFTASNSGF